MHWRCGHSAEFTSPSSTHHCQALITHPPFIIYSGQCPQCAFPLSIKPILRSWGIYHHCRVQGISDQDSTDYTSTHPRQSGHEMPRDLWIARHTWYKEHQHHFPTMPFIEGVYTLPLVPYQCIPKQNNICKICKGFITDHLSTDDAGKLRGYDCQSNGARCLPCGHVVGGDCISQLKEDGVRGSIRCPWWPYCERPFHDGITASYGREIDIGLRAIIDRFSAQIAGPTAPTGLLVKQRFWTPLLFTLIIYGHTSPSFLRRVYPEATWLIWYIKHIKSMSFWLRLVYCIHLHIVGFLTWIASLRLHKVHHPMLGEEWHWASVQPDGFAWNFDHVGPKGVVIFWGLLWASICGCG